MTCGEFAQTQKYIIIIIIIIIITAVERSVCPTEVTEPLGESSGECSSECCQKKRQ